MTRPSATVHLAVQSKSITNGSSLDLIKDCFVSFPTIRAN
ncbi:hypothetical protein SynNOUM97013_01335 [Synechococcus sp. NOUM97013]|nr:hypothetical protein SynNOUM97013_01335 [Synechococcus sp. NOUM97013]